MFIMGRARYRIFERLYLLHDLHARRLVAGFHPTGSRADYAGQSGLIEIVTQWA
jgi:hypothetical protein